MRRLIERQLERKYHQLARQIPSTDWRALDSAENNSSLQQAYLQQDLKREQRQIAFSFYKDRFREKIDRIRPTISAEDTSTINYGVGFLAVTIAGLTANPELGLALYVPVFTYFSFRKNPQQQQSPEQLITKTSKLIAD